MATNPDTLSGGDVKPADIRAYQAAAFADPREWVESCLDVKLWDKQAAVLEALRDHRFVCVRSGNAVGKSKVAAVAVHWWLHSHCPGYVVTTAPSFRIVERIIWPEVMTIHLRSKAKLEPAPLTTEWKLGPLWGAFGASADTAENFGGFHNPGGTLVIVDEASGLEEDIYTAIHGICADERSRILLIGNPLRSQGPFYQAFQSPMWHKIHISMFDVPNVVEKREVIPGLASCEMIDKFLDEWGEDSATYQARVLGEFPETSEDILIPTTWLDAALTRKYGETDESDIHMGVDVARLGADKTVLLIRDPVAIRHVEIRSHRTLMDTAGRVIALAQEWGVGAERVHVDDTGIGGGVVDRLRELDWAVDGVDFGKAASDPSRFINLRTECYWRTRAALDPRGATPLAIPAKHEKVARELGAHRFSYTSKGQIKLESKEELRKRLGKSPDMADALTLTYRPMAFVDMFWPEASRGRRAGVADRETLYRPEAVEDDSQWTF